PRAPAATVRAALSPRPRRCGGLSCSPRSRPHAAAPRATPPRCRRTSGRFSSCASLRDLDHVPEYRGRGRVAARAGAAPDQTWNEIALERDHIRRPRGLALERIGRDFLRPDAGFRRLVAEVGYREVTNPRAARGRAGHVGCGDAPETGAPHVVRVEMASLEDRHE